MDEDKVIKTVIGVGYALLHVIVSMFCSFATSDRSSEKYAEMYVKAYKDDLKKMGIYDGES